MPKSFLVDRDKETSKLIFGTGLGELNVSELSRRINLPASTLYSWRKTPRNMSLYGFARIARAKGMSDEEIAKVIKEIR